MPRDPHGPTSGPPDRRRPGPTLVVATSGPSSEVGLAIDGSELRTLDLGEGIARGRELLPSVRALLDGCGITIREVRAVVVDLGPGSFTGVRVGVTAARTLAWALALPAVGVTSLEAIAGAAPPEVEVLALRDAGRGQVYFARFGPGEPGRRPVRVPPARGGADAVRRARGDALPAGEEAGRLAQELGLEGPPLAVAAGVRAVLAAAGPRLDAGGPAPASAILPCYLQASAPERLRAGEAAGGRS
jgi:tRNA threonylcarbamoyladenosine biosynthesis protein TsaB